MSPGPANPKIYHISHVDNLPSMARTGSTGVRFPHAAMAGDVRRPASAV